MSSDAVLDARAREHSLDRLEAEAFDLAIVGGGIGGAGLAREAARRGLRVALLEAEDFAAGTSSRSSKLIHGGLRYLALGDVALVRTTALERKAVHRIAPHLAEPRWMLVPARSRASLLKFQVGLATYETLGAVADADRHRTWTGDELAREEPSLDRERYPYACAYREYLTDDARLVLANLRSAAADGALALAYAPVVGVLREGSRAGGVAVRCALSGRALRVRARAVVNAAGPWVDELAALEAPERPGRLHLSKGVHVCVPAERLPVNHLAVLAAPDRRSIFAIRRGGVVYLGTTDTSYAGSSRLWPEIGRADVEYLLAPASRDFAVEPLAPRDVVAAWAGLRPLVAEPGKPAREMSRKDEVFVGPLGVVSLAGGKLTGYRPMARATLERAAEVAGLALADRGDEPPLAGGDFPGDLTALAAALRRARPALEAAAAERLVRLYGAEADDVLALGDKPLAPGVPVFAGEVDWAVTREGACRLEDVHYRRTRAALYEPAAREAALEPAAEQLRGLLGWSDATRAAELARTRARLASDLDFAEDAP
ncbi:MAG TPA: glycerol-3-phosphate dehydrogenase/oxidase [Myxococcota bacterium]|nr:glycerol-3-phosphate dehydrogenase/oxidase [Myxococcota bacterium]